MIYKRLQSLVRLCFLPVYRPLCQVCDGIWLCGKVFEVAWSRELINKYEHLSMSTIRDCRH